VHQTEKQERVLLKQLPFYGKKTVPTKLRKDLWRPFATVTFPRPEDGLQAFKLLKEYRMVRNHAWTFAPTESDILTAAEQETAKRESGDTSSSVVEEDGYGAVKYATKYRDSVMAHYTAWPSKKERAKLIMDQRATSVADLAHIIHRQMHYTPAGKQHSADKQRAKLWAKIQALAATPAESIKKLEDETSALEASTASVAPHVQQSHQEKLKLKKRNTRIAEIVAHLNRLRKACEAVTFAAGGDVPEPLRAKWSKTLKYIVQMQDPSRAVLSNYDRSAAESRKELEANKRPINWPLSTKFDGSGVPKMLSRRDKIALKGAAPEVDTRAEKGIPESVILIQWASLPDAQFAGEWHADVVHEEMASKYARKAEKKYKELREGEDALGEEGGPDSDRYAARGGKTMKEPEKTGWIGALNPLRLLRGGSGGEARV
jgi:hypothetical protein